MSRSDDRAGRRGHSHAISFTVLAFNMSGDALRDILDPRLRGT